MRSGLSARYSAEIQIQRNVRSPGRRHGPSGPHGPGADLSHRCPGTDYTTYFMMVFTAVLLRSRVRWDFPAQCMEYDWRLIPPEPKDGLRVEVRR